MIRVALNCGARDVLLTHSPEHCTREIKQIIESQQLLPRATQENNPKDTSPTFEGIFAKSTIMWDLFETASQVAATDATVLILGETGRNFAAGMSGGIAYVFDLASDFASRCNPEMVQLFDLTDEAEAEFVRNMIDKHVKLTGSELGWRILDEWDESIGKFVKVYPSDYRRVIEAQETIRKEGLSEEDVLMAAFQKNISDRMRAGGN